MAAWNTTVQDYSPLITYSPIDAWKTGSNVSTPNPGFYDYFNDDYMTTNMSNATASFLFNGTGVWVYGSKGRNHGEYTVLLDGQATVHNGTSIPLFQTLLFGADHLSQGQHTLQVVNTEKDLAYSNLDIDFITWEQSRPDDDTLLQHFIKVTAQANWDYGPSWSLEQTPQVQEQQLVTASSNSTVTLTFSGSHIDVYGSTNADCGSFVASIDGDEWKGPFPCYTPAGHSHVLLYSTDTAEPGSHNLTIIGKEDHGRSGLVLSHAVATTSINFRNASDLPPLAGSSGSQTGTLSTRMVLIITFSILSPLLVLALLYLLFVRRPRIHRIRPDPERKLHLDEEIGHTNGTLIMPSGRHGIQVDLSNLGAWADGKRVDRLPYQDSLEESIGRERRQEHNREQPPQLQLPEQPRSGDLKRSRSSPPWMSSQTLAGRTRHVEVAFNHTRATRAAAVPRLIIPSDTSRAAGYRYTRGGSLEEYGFGRARSSPMTPPFAPQTTSPPPFPEFLTPPPGLPWDAGRRWREKRRRLSHPPPPAYEQAMASAMNSSS